MERIRPGDTLYLGARAVEPWLFYAMDWRRPDLDLYAWLTAAGATTGPAHENAPSRGHAIANEGDDLVRDWNGIHIMVGIPTGQFFDMAPIETQRLRRADRGFLPNELRRLQKATGRLFLLSYRDGETARSEIARALWHGREGGRLQGEEVMAIEGP
jgi:hypothetical protein